MIGMLSFLSVIVALIGLVGLVSYSVEVRKKEIGIRKVFGASLSHIMIMFNNQYAKLIAIALVIASPISWILISKWLNSFAYKIEIHGYVFLLAGVIELIIAGLCVGYISLRAALMNPAETLNYE